ncbi:peptidylprolyl isomerase [Oceanobacillus massiliensis]|uniref:peptidylprolyl isomerase n=1 Tax=Oceanobacillus massiliensis TaxID=1465765 RepID=UPI0002888F1D|nr:peptidyl-prolyl cis-trans isomerase [Oceanobacillus massiliensis]
MSKKLLLGIIVVLLITNIASLLFWNKEEKVVINDEDSAKIDSAEPVASIGSEKVSYQQWMEELRSEYGEKQLKSMIDHEVVNQLAEENNIEVDEKVIDREISFLYTMQGIMTEEEAEKEEAKWREDIIYRYQLQDLLTKDMSILEEELQTYYEGYGDQYDFTESVQISHILVDDFETADKVVAELEQGASFDLLAKEYSIDDETKASGGYLGSIYTSSQFLPSSYEEVALKMDNHSYSEPFQADNGVAILYLHRKLPSITFDYEEIKPYMESELAMQEMNQSLSADPLWEQLEIDWVYGN